MTISAQARDTQGRCTELMQRILFILKPLKNHAVLVSLDEDNFLLGIKERVGIETYNPKDSLNA